MIARYMTDDFDGATFSPVLDGSRLTSQLWHVRQLMSNGNWWTLAALAEGVNGTEAAVSARLRDLRKPRFGGHHVEKKRDTSLKGVWLYRLALGKPSNKGRQRPRRLGPGDVARCLEILSRTQFDVHDELPISRLRAWLRSNLSDAGDDRPVLLHPTPSRATRGVEIVKYEPMTVPELSPHQDFRYGTPMATERPISPESQAPLGLKRYADKQIGIYNPSELTATSFSFCESDRASGWGTWCIRKWQTTEPGASRLRLSGWGTGIDTPSLCGSVPVGWGWDLEASLTEDNLVKRACKECLAKYREMKR